MNALLTLILFVAGIDRRGLFGILRRPLVLCTLAGAAMGNATTGASVGAALEILCIACETTNVSGANEDGFAFCSLMAVVLAISAGLDASGAAVAALPFALIGGLAGNALSLVDTLFLPLARSAAEKRDEKLLSIYHFIPMLVNGIAYAVCGTILASLGASASGWIVSFTAANGWLMETLRMAASLVPCIGLAVLLRNIQMKDVYGCFFGGAAIMMLCAKLAMGPAGLFVAAGAAVTVGYVVYQMRLAKPQDKNTKGGASKWW